MLFLEIYWRACSTFSADTTCIVRRTRIDLERISADTRTRRRRTVPKDQLALADAGLCDHVYRYSFILTNLDVTTPRRWPRPSTGTATAPTSRR
jgi:hypothetical protein